MRLNKTRNSFSLWTNFRFYLPFTLFAFQNEVKTVVFRKRRNMKLAFDHLKSKKKGKWVLTFNKWKQLINIMKPKMSPVQVILYWRVLDENNAGHIGENLCFSIFLFFSMNPKPSSKRTVSINHKLSISFKCFLISTSYTMYFF